MRAQFYTIGLKLIKEKRKKRRDKWEDKRDIRRYNSKETEGCKEKRKTMKV